MRKGLVGSLILCGCVLAMIASAALPAAADTIAYYVPLQPGNQNYMGSLGMDFNVNSAIWLTSIGVFDPNAVYNKPLAGPLTVAIYDRTTEQPLPETLKTFPAGTSGPLIGANLFTAITPYFLLQPGQYSIVAWGYKLEQMNGNSGCSDGSCAGVVGPVISYTNNGGGVITFVGTSRFGQPGQYPDYVDGGPNNRYLAGTFSFEDASNYPLRDAPTAPVPEPGTLALLAPALLGLGRFLRRS